MCYGELPAKYAMRDADARLSGVAQQPASAAPRQSWLARLRGFSVPLAFLGAFGLSGCVVVDENRYAAGEQTFVFSFLNAPKGTVCDATVASGSVTKDTAFLGAPRVTVTGAASSAVVTCTLPDGSVYMTNLAAQLPFAAYGRIEATGLFSPRYAALPIDANVGGMKQSYGNSMVRVQ